jgi:hypothetical protein
MTQREATPSAAAAAKPDWLAAAEASIRDDPREAAMSFLGSRGVALSVLNVESGRGGAIPQRYDANLHRTFARFLADGLATLDAEGRLHVTDRGREEWEWYWLEAWG